jgi:endogenous inhibitor of DNA gyrase (YacG/DUF329 family)
MSNPHTVSTVKCAVCGKQKESVNHWYIINAFRIPAPDAAFVCWPLEQVVEIKDEHDEPVCGQECAQKRFERWMTEQRNGNQTAEKQTAIDGSVPA